MVFLPSSSPAALASSGHGILSTVDNAATVLISNIAQESARPVARFEELEKKPQNTAWFPKPDPGCRYKLGHGDCNWHGMRATDDGDMTVDWSGMHRQDNAQVLRVEGPGPAANVKTGAPYPSHPPLVSNGVPSKRTEQENSIVMDNNVKDSIMDASDKDLDELAQSFSDSKSFPEWYKKLPEAQRDMFDKKPKAYKPKTTGPKAGDRQGDKKDGKQGGKKGDDKEKEKGKGTKNSASALTIHTLLKISTMAMFVMAVL